MKKSHIFSNVLLKKHFYIFHDIIQINLFLHRIIRPLFAGLFILFYFVLILGYFFLTHIGLFLTESF